MNFRPVHQNLDTSFVNLSALLKYLRRRQFAGIVRVRLNNYEAEIHITDENQLNVREQDHLSGRVSEGEEALQRILIRSREPGGIVNVFQKVNGVSKAAEISEIKDEPKPLEVSKKPEISKPAIAAVKSASIKTGRAAERTALLSAENLKPEIAPKKVQTAPQNPENQTPKSTVSLPEFPFRLSNNVEAKAKLAKVSPEQFQKLVEIFAEILNTIDKTLASADLNFTAAFEKACAEISGDYPFLRSEENIFQYRSGEIKINAPVNPNLFKSSLLEVIRRILERLGANPKFSETYRTATQNLLALLSRRKPLYDEFYITQKLEKILGA